MAKISSSQAPAVRWPRPEVEGGRIWIDAALRFQDTGSRTWWAMRLGIGVERLRLTKALSKRRTSSIAELMAQATLDITRALDSTIFELSSSGLLANARRRRRLRRLFPFELLGVPASLRLDPDESRGFDTLRSAGRIQGLQTELLLALHLPLDEVLTGVVHGRPRGLKAKAAVLLRVAAVALLVADRLVRKADLDPVLTGQINTLLSNEDDEDGQANENAQDRAVALVDRALSGAWERYGVTPLCARSFAADAYRDLLPAPRRQDLGVLLDRANAEGAWAQRLLHGSPGHAAREFGLI